MDFIDKLTFKLFSPYVQTMANGFYYDTANNDMPTEVFLVLFAVSFSLILYLLRKVESFAPERNSLAIIIFFAVLLRLIALPGEPIHENDIYRYIWDGKSVNKGINPYKYPPADLFMYEEGHESDYYDDYHEVILKARNVKRAG